MSAVLKWNSVHAVILMACSVTVFVFGTPVFVALAGAASFAVFFRLSGVFSRFRERNGYAHGITLIRLVMTLLIGFLYFLLSNGVIAAAAAVIVLLDALDGYLAKKYHSESPEGSYFDMETDALYVCVLCSVIYIRGFIGPWVLLAGFARYIYVVILLLAGYGNREEPSALFSRLVAGFLFCSVITPFVLERSAYLPVVSSAALLLLISFSFSFVRHFREGRVLRGAGPGGSGCSIGPP